jgi:hypothetical protein
MSAKNACFGFMKSLIMCYDLLNYLQRLKLPKHVVRYARLLCIPQVDFLHSHNISCLHDSAQYNLNEKFESKRASICKKQLTLTHFSKSSPAKRPDLFVCGV